jgi:hypothetical protein
VVVGVTPHQSNYILTVLFKIFNDDLCPGLFSSFLPGPTSPPFSHFLPVDVHSSFQSNFQMYPMVLCECREQGNSTIFIKLDCDQNVMGRAQLDIFT